MTKEQSDLIRRAQASLEAARLLAKEGYYNFAVSRTYDAMFYIASAFLLGERLAFLKHSAVIAAFGQYFSKTGRVSAEYHRYLIEGESSRNAGDYDVATELTLEAAEEQLSRAEKFLKLARETFGDIQQSP